MVQIPTPDMASDRLELLLRYLISGTARDIATADIATGLRPVLTQFLVAVTASIESQRALVDPRVGVRFAERDIETTIRRLASDARKKDGKDRGATLAALFPGGLEAATVPRGEAQQEAASRVMNALRTVGLAEPLRAEHVPALEAAITAFQSALDERRRVAGIAASAFAAELAGREDLCNAMDAAAGAIRRLFPRDRDRQDLYFDAVRTKKRKGGGSDGDDPPPTT